MIMGQHGCLDVSSCQRACAHVWALLLGTTGSVDKDQGTTSQCADYWRYPIYNKGGVHTCRPQIDFALSNDVHCADGYTATWTLIQIHVKS